MFGLFFAAISMNGQGAKSCSEIFWKSDGCKKEILVDRFWGDLAEQESHA